MTDHDPFVPKGGVVRIECDPQPKIHGVVRVVTRQDPHEKIHDPTNDPGGGECQMPEEFENNLRWKYVRGLIRSGVDLLRRYVFGLYPTSGATVSLGHVDVDVSCVVNKEI